MKKLEKRSVDERVCSEGVKEGRKGLTVVRDGSD
jgi:hypothetical protein